MEEQQQERTVGDFLFFTECDAQLAKEEQKKIEYLEARIDYTRPDSILYVYNKAIQERIFKTPVGLAYLKNLRGFLLQQKAVSPDSVRQIPLYITFDGEIRETSAAVRPKVRPSAAKSEERKKAEKHRFWFTISVIGNLLLVIAICAMFSISLKSDNPNIINYKTNLINRYASWEQELTERENAVREKERELRFTD